MKGEKESAKFVNTGRFKSSKLCACLGEVADVRRSVQAVTEKSAEPANIRTLYRKCEWKNDFVQDEKRIAAEENVKMTPRIVKLKDAIRIPEIQIDEGNKTMLPLLARKEIFPASKTGTFTHRINSKKPPLHLNELKLDGEKPGRGKIGAFELLNFLAQQTIPFKT